MSKLLSRVSKYVSVSAALLSLIAAVITFYSLQPGIVRQLRSFLGDSTTSRVNPITTDTSVVIQPNDSTLSIMNTFVPSGWMGDGELGQRYVQMDFGLKANDSLNSCARITYKIGPRYWAGDYWLNQQNNWGNQPGLNLSKENFSRIAFWARGERGGEIIEFRAGGIAGKKFSDSFSASTGRIKLENRWQKFMIDLKGKNLSNVVGAFCWIASVGENPGGITFYVCDARFEH